MVRTQRSHCRGPWVQSLVGELRPHKPHGVTKKKKKERRHLLETTQVPSLEAPSSGFHRVYQGPKRCLRAE